MKRKRRIVIVGATSAISERCARLWLEQQAADLTLVGRNAQRVERIAGDFRVRYPESDIQTVEANFSDAELIGRTVDKFFETGNVDVVLIAHGALPEQVNCQNVLTECYAALQVNGISPVLFAEAFAKHMAKSNHGTMGVIGSVAGDRGRKSNYVYGAAKGLVERYVQGMQHRFANTNVRVVLIKPGPTDTPMTAHLKKKGLASVAFVSQQIVTGMASKKTVVYTPHKWRIIMAIIRHIPCFIFNKLDI